MVRSAPPHSSVPQSQRGKTIAACGLGVVFVAVLGLRLWPAPEAAADAPTAAAPAVPQSAWMRNRPGTVPVAWNAEANGQDAEGPTEQAASALPPLDLGRLVLINPFVVPRYATAGRGPSGVRSSLREASQSDAEGETRSEDVNGQFELRAIVRNGASSAVLVDGRLLQIDDVVDDQWRVVEITPTGVVLQPLDGHAAR